MPFDWYHPDLPADYSVSPQKADQMYLQELGTRAALLMRLGYDKQDTKLRLRGNVQWDFELHNKPEHLKKIDEMVDEVYAHGGFAGGGPPMLE